MTGKHQMEGTRVGHECRNNLGTPTDHICELLDKSQLERDDHGSMDIPSEGRQRSKHLHRSRSRVSL